MTELPPQTLWFAGVFYCFQYVVISFSAITLRFGSLRQGFQHGGELLHLRIIEALKGFFCVGVRQ